MINKEQQQLVIDNIPLVGFIAKKFKPRNRNEYDDLVQQGTIALIDAVSKYDKERAKLSTLVHICVYREIRRYLEKNIRANIKKKINIEEEMQMPVSEYFGDDLSDIEKRVVELKLEGHSYAAIERICGRKRNWAGKVLRRALSKIKEAAPWAN